MTLPKDLKEFIELLNSHEVRYLIVEGYAVAYHGYPRMTGDIDVFIDVSPENATRMKAVMDAFGFGSLGLTSKDFLEPGVIIQLGNPPNRIDLLTSVSGVTFSTAWDRKVGDEIDGLVMVFVSREDLLANKAAAGRPKDLADLDALS